MRKQTQQKLLGLLDSCTRKIQRAQKAGTRAAFIAVAQHAALIANVVRAELKPREQQEPLQVLGGVEQALNALPVAPDVALCRETAALLQELIDHLRQQVAQARTKKLIVFLPYKASMWDSLESIWMAADKDREHCQTMVVPIPYADRNPDGTAAQWHYEIGLYPKYVPVIDHRSVDLEKLHPDVIFIHNPYDNYNAVTSVDMQYYSFRLKQYTDCLVYVPYFVVDTNIAPHFVQTPAVVNADYVIVQDDIIREQYENFYPGGKPPSGKILGLGSPKFDKVQHTTRADYTLPTEWLRLIRGRKIVLYNTSLTTMLNYTSFFCRKLREVFEFFRQRQDVVLWWRPHPLLRATFESIRPEYYEEYCALEQQYRDAGWGIYDDTPDVDRAIVCSDAYYGDLASSVVWLYRVTGKPMLFQEMSGTRFAPYFFFDLAEQPDATWLMRPFMRNGLVEIQPSTGKMRLKGDFSRPALLAEAAFSNPYFACQQVGTQFYILPWMSQDLCIYDMKAQAYQHIDLGQQGLHGSLFIVGARAYAGHLYCWGYKYGIIEYDMQMQRVVATHRVADVKLGSMDTYGILNAAGIVGTRLYLAHNQTNGFIWFDFVSKESGFCEAGETGMCFAALTVVDEQLWLLGRAPYLVCYDLRKGQWQQYALPLQRPLLAAPYFVNIFKQGGELLLLPCCEYFGADEVIRFNLAFGQLHVEHRAGGYSQAIQLQDGSVAAQNLQRMQVDLYAQDGTVQTIPLQPDQQLTDEWQIEYQQGKVMHFYERYDMPMMTFVQHLQGAHVATQYRREPAGKQIYQMVLTALKQ